MRRELLCAAPARPHLPTVQLVFNSPSPSPPTHCTALTNPSCCPVKLNPSTHPPPSSFLLSPSTAMASAPGLYQLRAVPSREEEKRTGPVGEEERERTSVGASAGQS